MARPEFCDDTSSTPASGLSSFAQVGFGNPRAGLGYRGIGEGGSQYVLPRVGSLVVQSKPLPLASLHLFHLPGTQRSYRQGKG